MRAIVWLTLGVCLARVAHAQDPASAASAAGPGGEAPTDQVLPAPEPAGSSAEALSPVGVALDLQTAGALELLSEAESAMLAVDYARSQRLAAAALKKGGMSRDETLRAYRVLAVASAQAGDSARAEPAFLKLFALDPNSRVARRLSPDRREAVLNAKGFWSVRQGSFGLEVKFDRRDRRLYADVRDPLKWARLVHVWYRFGQRPFVRASQAVGTNVAFSVSDELGAAEPLEVYAFLVDDHANVITEFGAERTPRVFALNEEEQAALSRRDIRGGQAGSFGKRLEELGARVTTHGYVSAELKPVNGKTSFDVHHATVLFRAELIPAVSAEFGVEFEHLTLEIEDLYLPHAFIDVRQSELLTVRAGFFEAPIGAFNEYLYPDFLRVTGASPLLADGIVPALWSEVGLQLRGRLALYRDWKLTYAAFVSNGLEQRDASPEDGVVEEGGGIKAMRFNARDSYHGDKALGGRLGVEVEEFDIGISAYTGRYTIERARRLSLLDADFSFRSRYVTLRAEAAVALQEVTGDVLHKYGGYALLAARPLPEVEPYAHYDFVKIGSRQQRGLIGLALYPFPARGPTRSLRLKSEVGYLFPESGPADFVWFEQLTAGF